MGVAQRVTPKARRGQKLSPTESGLIRSHDAHPSGNLVLSTARDPIYATNMIREIAAAICFSACGATVALAAPPTEEAIPIWPDLAPGETTKDLGTPLPPNPADPTITRVTKITHPTMRAYLPQEGATGAAVVVLPGGGFRYVVPNLEGSEAATFLNALGTAVFVLNYRTTEGSKSPERWRRPLQDSQRAIRYLRTNAKRWSLDPKKIGLLAFSAGGQVGAIHIGDFGDAYKKIDAVDEASARPDFAMLIYPWNVADAKGEMMPQVKISKAAPPTFLVHTDDDRSSALGSVGIYTALHRAGVSGEIHVYKNGGHGYGTRARDGSMIGSWSARASDWLRARGLTK